MRSILVLLLARLSLVGQVVPDHFGNLWRLENNRLRVQTAQNPGSWADDSHSGLPSGEWRKLTTDDCGLLLISSEVATLRMDPRAPSKGWVRAEASDARGKSATYWEVIGQLPAANHDLSGDVMNGKLYLAGGQTAEWGYPATRHIFDEVLEIDGQRRQMQVVGTLLHPRYYNGTSYLNGEIWIVGGSRRDADWQAHDLNTVEVLNLKSGRVRQGPALPVPMEMAAAFHIRGRIYAMGAPVGAGADSPLPLFSIGSGEANWRREPEGPASRKNIAATVWSERLYVLLPGKGLGVFDPASRSWALIDLPEHARSSQIAAYRNEIWIMGGEDIASHTGTLIYNPTTGATRRGPDLPRALSWGAAAVTGERLVVAGGAGGACYSDSIFALR